MLLIISTSYVHCRGSTTVNVVCGTLTDADALPWTLVARLGTTCVRLCEGIGRNISARQSRASGWLAKCQRWSRAVPCGVKHRVRLWLRRGHGSPVKLLRGKRRGAQLEYLTNRQVATRMVLHLKRQSASAEDIAAELTEKRVVSQRRQGSGHANRTGHSCLRRSPNEVRRDRDTAGLCKQEHQRLRIQRSGIRRRRHLERTV